MERLGASLEAERPDQPDDTQKMVGVEMREKYLGQGEADPVAHHLPLGAFPALEQQRLPFTHQRDG